MTPNSSDAQAALKKKLDRLKRAVSVCQDIYAVVQKHDKVVYPVKVRDGLIPAVCEHTGIFEIKLLPKYWDSRYLLGYLERYHHQANITYSMQLNTCWKRFVVCKELAHLMLDGTDDCTKDLVTLVQGLLLGFPVVLDDAALASEEITMLAAIELMLPWCIRDELYEMAKGGKSHLQIATEARVPQKIVTLILGSPYGDLSRKVNLEVAAAKAAKAAKP